MLVTKITRCDRPRRVTFLKLARGTGAKDPREGARVCKDRDVEQQAERTESLLRLARECGVATEYWSFDGHEQQVSADTLVAVLKRLAGNTGRKAS
mgnify:CR=1 FL=1